MPDGYAGRLVVVKRNAVAVAGVRTKTITINNEAIDVTSDDDLGWRTLLEAAAVQSVDIAVEGVVRDDILRNSFFNGTVIDDMTIEWPDGGRVNGNFRVQGYSETGPYNDALTFSCTFASTGAVTYTDVIT